jgi:hypothetical protein
LKTPRWKLIAVIILINFARIAISVELSIQFFIFRMVNVTCLYLAYLFLDSLEGIIVFYRRDAWGPAQIVAYYFNNTIMLFAITAGVFLYLPLFFFLQSIGFEVSTLYTIEVWAVFSAATFIIVLLMGYAANAYWGNIQNLIFRFCFLIYCSYQLCQLYPSRAPLIPLVVIAAACILAVEIKKYGWSLRELRKKDIRFRHSDPAPPPIVFK